MQIQYEFHLYVIHVLGKRIIKQGTNGLTRDLLGHMLVVNGSIPAYVILNKGAFEQNELLRKWVKG